VQGASGSRLFPAVIFPLCIVKEIMKDNVVISPKPAKISRLTVLLLIIFGLLIFSCVLNPGGCTNSVASKAFSDGYKDGEAVGRAQAYSGGLVPTAEGLNGIAAYRLQKSSCAPYDSDIQRSWKDGFAAGFEVGYKAATNPAF
jgi:hypothetical protein